MHDEPIYLDNHATTRTDPRVVEAMFPYFGVRYGNPTSRVHAIGQDAADALDAARKSVAAAIGAEPRQIVFTSGATEANRMVFDAVLGQGTRRHVVISAIEHKSVLDGSPGPVTKVAVGAGGIVDPAALRAAVGPETALVSVMAANNEIGTIQPLAEIAEICRGARVAFHCDATAAVGRIPFDVRASGCDFASFSAHKFYGPKGVGALYVRSASGPAASRPGTPNVPGIVGLAKALDLCVLDMADDRRALLALRTRLLDRLRSALDGVAVNGDLDRRLEGNLNVTIPGVDGRALVVSLRGLAVSSGSACASASVEPSHVLVALGMSKAAALASVRFGIGRFNTADEIDRAAAIVASAVTKLRAASGYSGGRVAADRARG